MYLQVKDRKLSSPPARFVDPREELMEAIRAEHKLRPVPGRIGELRLHCELVFCFWIRFLRMGQWSGLLIIFGCTLLRTKPLRLSRKTTWHAVESMPLLFSDRMVEWAMCVVIVVFIPLHPLPRQDPPKLVWLFEECWIDIPCVGSRAVRNCQPTYMGHVNPLIFVERRSLHNVEYRSGKSKPATTNLGTNVLAVLPSYTQSHSVRFYCFGWTISWTPTCSVENAGISFRECVETNLTIVGCPCKICASDAKWFCHFCSFWCKDCRCLFSAVITFRHVSNIPSKHTWQTNIWKAFVASFVAEGWRLDQYKRFK